jgi:hypothetical protein
LQRRWSYFFQVKNAFVEKDRQITGLNSKLREKETELANLKTDLEAKEKQVNNFGRVIYRRDPNPGFPKKTHFECQGWDSPSSTLSQFSLLAERFFFGKLAVKY